MKQFTPPSPTAGLEQYSTDTLTKLKSAHAKAFHSKDHWSIKRLAAINAELNKRKENGQ